MAGLLGAHPCPRQVLNPSCVPAPPSSLGSHVAPVSVPIDFPSNSNLPSSLPCSFVSPPHLGRILSSPSWANVAQRIALEGSKKLKIFPPLAVVGDTATITPPPEVIDQGRQLWGSTLVGHFYETPPHLLAIRGIVRILWKRFGPEHVASNDPGFFVFCFSSLQKMEQCFLAGPWMIAGKAIFLEHLLPGMQLCKEPHKSFPIWINLYNVPVEFWSPVGLGWIASAIGKPTHLCPRTATMENLGVAQIFVKVDAEASFPTRIILKSSSEPASFTATELVVNVEYSWKPNSCGCCQLFGHGESNCISMSSADEHEPLPNEAG